MMVGQQQARLHMQQQAIIQQHQQQAMFQQQQQLQQQQQQQGQPPMGQMTPQRQEAQLPQQHHPMGQSPQVDPAQRMMGPAGNDFDNENKGRGKKKRAINRYLFFHSERTTTAAYKPSRSRNAWCYWTWSTNGNGW